VTIGILGGGVAGLSLANFLHEETIIFEKESQVGGLCRSFDFEGIPFDIGPHILFSKNKAVLDFHSTLTEMASHNRLNRILLRNKLVKYPFENNLNALEPDDRDYCLREFIHNPYRAIDENNMLQFFLKNFGEGITDLYLYPYNKKIWKMDPSCLDLQMVERIPKPPVQDVIDGAEGSPKEGYTHQAKFLYPTAGGFQTIVDAYEKRIIQKGDTIVRNFEISKIDHQAASWSIKSTSGQKYTVDKIVSTIPLPELNRIVGANSFIEELSSSSLYNSIHIVMLRYRGDTMVDQFALYVPDSKIIFHRLSRLNFFGSNYGAGSGDLFLMAEVTFRPNSYLANVPTNEIVSRCVDDLDSLGIANRKNLKSSLVKTFPYAYVIYDLNHRYRTDMQLDYFRNKGILCHGRFGKFEYQNSDKVVEDSMELANRINSSDFTSS
jgi:protoporphyrinogen oxidase